METKSLSQRRSKPSNKMKNKNKPKNHPLKVVYISNPMKITTTASDFQSIVQRLTGKGAVWPSDLEFSDNQTLPNSAATTTSSDNNVSIISDESDHDVNKDCGVEFRTPNPSPDTSIATDDLYFQPLDHDAVLLFDLPVIDDQDIEYPIGPDGLDLLDYWML